MGSIFEYLIVAKSMIKMECQSDKRLRRYSL